MLKRQLDGQSPEWINRGLGLIFKIPDLTFILLQGFVAREFLQCRCIWYETLPSIKPEIASVKKPLKSQCAMSDLVPIHFRRNECAIILATSLRQLSSHLRTSETAVIRLFQQRQHNCCLIHIGIVIFSAKISFYRWVGFIQDVQALPKLKRYIAFSSNRHD